MINIPDFRKEQEQSMEINQLWENVCLKLREQVNDVLFNVWIEPLEPHSLINGHEMVIIAPSQFHKEVVIDQHIGEKIEKAIFDTVGFEVTLRLLVKGEDIPEDYISSDGEISWHDAVEKYNASSESRRPGQMYSSTNDSSYEYTFDTFIVGSSNKFAHAASVAVAENPGGAYNPLFIYGPSGMGKTHLLFAIQNEVLRRYPNMTVKYIKGDQFTNELIEAIGQGRQNEFHQKYRYIDVLMVDDVQFIGGKEQTQEEFFHTFNTLHQEHKQIILTSDRPPREIQTLESRLRSRFEMGLLADIQPPEFETRIAIIKRKAKQCNMEISDEIAEFIAERLKSNIRQLEGVVKRINATYQLEKELPSLTMAQNAIRDVMNDVQPTPITIERIIEEVARTFEVTAKDIKSPKRAAQISQARQVAMYVVREVTNLSYEDIGKEFGRDHSTAIYAVQQVERNMKTRSDFRNMVNDLIKNIKVSAQ